MDASKFYALLRFEEASLALRATLRMGLVDVLGSQDYREEQLRSRLSFTQQAGRTFFHLLQVMQVLERTKRGAYRVTEQARVCLAEKSPQTRRPYLAMGIGEEVDLLIDLLRGEAPEALVSLYGDDKASASAMDNPEVGREVALGLASRARNFAEPLASAISACAKDARSVADLGAGSPYVVQACLRAMPHLERAMLVDRENALGFARELISSDKSIEKRIVFCEGDFFQSVPTADVYCISNTAHDWEVDQYSRIIAHIRSQISPGGVICIHEPLLESGWRTDAEWIRALWMACYALTLFRLTLGQGTCYLRKEHDDVLAKHGFRRLSEPIETCDGCSALFYSLE